MEELRVIWENFGPSALIVGAATLLWTKVTRLEEKANEHVADRLALWDAVNALRDYLLNHSSGGPH